MCAVAIIKDLGVFRCVWPTSMGNDLLLTICIAHSFLLHHDRRLLVCIFDPLCIVKYFKDLTSIDKHVDISGKPSSYLLCSEEPC